MTSDNDYHPRLMTPQEAVAEASRCLSCHDAPCRDGCPASNDIVKFIRQIAQRNFRSAIKTIREYNVLAGTCALICPVGELCEFRCTTKLQKPIAIGELQRFVAEYDRQQGMSLLSSNEPNGMSVGIIGSGPAGLSAAFELCRLGYNVEIHEADDLPGGILTYGIPSYRLNPEMVNDEIEFVKAMGAKIITNSKINSLAEFQGKYDAVFIGVGAYNPINLEIEDSHLESIYQAITFLKDRKVAELHKKPPIIALGKNAIVIGGGNTAIDAAQSAQFSGTDVTIYYRRGETDMPAFKSEIESAKKSGVKFKFNYVPSKFQILDGKIKATFMKTKPGEPDKSGRPTPVLIDGSDKEILVDDILIAIGQGATFKESDKIKTDSSGLVVIDKESGATSMPGIFAGGDAVNGGATAVRAVAEGRRAAHGIDEYLKNRTKQGSGKGGST